MALFSTFSAWAKALKLDVFNPLTSPSINLVIFWLGLISIIFFFLLTSCLSIIKIVRESNLTVRYEAKALPPLVQSFNVALLILLVFLWVLFRITYVRPSINKA